jgi:hypothetical protein
MVAPVVMTNIASVVMLVIAAAMIPSSSVVAVPPPVMSLPLVMMVGFPEVRIPLSVLGVGGRGYCWDN